MSFKGINFIGKRAIVEEINTKICKCWLTKYGGFESNAGTFDVNIQKC